MKTIRYLSLIALFLLPVFIASIVYAGVSPEMNKNPQETILTFKGKVIDSETGAPLVFVSVAVKETNVATVTNIDGEFSIKVYKTQVSRNLEVSFLGYSNKIVPLDELREDGYRNVIELTPAPIPIKEIIIKPIDPEHIVRNAIGRIGRNYTNEANLMTAFYREARRLLRFSRLPMPTISALMGQGYTRAERDRMLKGWILFYSSFRADRSRCFSSTWPRTQSQY